MILVMRDAVMFARALADETRWRIIQLVLDQAFCVCELADILEMPQSTVSSHVQIIRKAGLLESEKREKWTYFRVDPAHLAVIRAIAKHFPDDALLPAERARAALRLSKRATSCCPGPQKLVAQRSSKPTKTTP